MRSKVAILVLGAVAASLFVACIAGTAAIELPPGVKESQWRPLSEDLGVVVRGVEGNNTTGYFMCKVNGKWLPLVIQNPTSFIPAE